VQFKITPGQCQIADGEKEATTFCHLTLTLPYVTFQFLNTVAPLPVTQTHIYIYLHGYGMHVRS
jgi:hypothetical protein